jgi:hypothetical protein
MLLSCVSSATDTRARASSHHKFPRTTAPGWTAPKLATAFWKTTGNPGVGLQRQQNANCWPFGLPIPTHQVTRSTTDSPRSELNSDHAKHLSLASLVKHSSCAAARHGGHHGQRRGLLNLAAELVELLLADNSTDSHHRGGERSVRCLLTHHGRPHHLGALRKRSPTSKQALRSAVHPAAAPENTDTPRNPHFEQ